MLWPTMLIDRNEMADLLTYHCYLPAERSEQTSTGSGCFVRLSLCLVCTPNTYLGACLFAPTRASMTQADRNLPSRLFDQLFCPQAPLRVRSWRV